MCKVLRLELAESNYKPLFSTVTNYRRRVLCLFDTGATMPVWCGSKGLNDGFLIMQANYDKGYTGLSEVAHNSRISEDFRDKVKYILQNVNLRDIVLTRVRYRCI